MQGVEFVLFQREESLEFGYPSGMEGLDDGVIVPHAVINLEEGREGIPEVLAIREVHCECVAIDWAVSKVVM